jgi:D-amino-acid dehydrogenase
LNAHALPAWERLLSQLGLEHHLRRRGFLSVWSDRSAFAASAHVIAHQRAHAIPVETLEAADVRKLEPALGPAAVAGAYYETGCHVSDPRDLTNALGEAALARGGALRQARGVVVAPETTGVRVACADGSSFVFDAVVIAAGAWSRPLAAPLGDRIPLDTERGYNITLPRGSLGLSRPVAFEGYGFVTTPLDTGDRVGGAVEFGGLEAAPNFARVDAMLGRLKPFVPDATFDGGERWMGFRPSIPDSLPVIGRSRKDARIVYAFGHGHYGLTQAAATAQLVAAVLGGRAAALDLAPFSPQRF